MKTSVWHPQKLTKLDQNDTTILSQDVGICESIVVLFPSRVVDFSGFHLYIHFFIQNTFL